MNAVREDRGIIKKLHSFRLAEQWPTRASATCASIGRLDGGRRLNPNPFLGVLLHWTGGLSAASCYLPFRGIRRWSWEIYWLVQGIFSWIVVPPIFAALLVPGFAGDPARRGRKHTVLYLVLGSDVGYRRAAVRVGGAVPGDRVGIHRRTGIQHSISGRWCRRYSPGNSARLRESAPGRW